MENTPVSNMTLRDWFAGQALIGVIMKYGTGERDQVGSLAYTLADQMMKERTK